MTGAGLVTDTRQLAGIARDEVMFHYFLGGWGGTRVAQNFPKLNHSHKSHICCYATFEDSKNTNIRSVACA